MLRTDRLLDGRIAVVTGGGAGIGGAIARLFAAHGAVLEIAEIDAARGADTVRAIGAEGGEACAHTLDVTDGEAVARFGKEVLGRRGRVDVLVNNVGHYLEALPFRHSTPEHWEALYAVNLRHVFAITHAFLPAMVERGGGSIVNLHSVEGLRGYPPDPVYGAFKAAVAHFTTCLAVEVGRKGVRVNGIGPDLIQTPQVDYRAAAAGREALWEVWAPLGRCGEPADVANVALFLASEQSAFVTGHNIPVDGGTRAGGGWYWSPAKRRWVNRPESP